MNYRLETFVLLALLPFSVLSKEFNYPGGIIDIRIDKQSNELPEVKYGLQDVTIIERAKSWQILIGIDLDTLPGEYLVYIKRAVPGSSALSHTFQVRQNPGQILKRSNADAHDIEIRHSSMSDIGYANTQQPSLPLAYPAGGQWADYFGYTVADQQRGKTTTQNYITLTTTELINVIAPQNAIVSRIQPYQKRVTGRTPKPATALSTVFLDHGRGLYSIISGITDLSVKTGNGVVAGAVIGKTPSSSGRDGLSNQPSELIWQCVLNGAYINPIILTQIQ